MTTSNKFLNTKIINGTEAQNHSWPWIVTIQHPLLGHFCGGSLIDHNYVISAAHCFFSIFFYDSIIYIGNHKVDDRVQYRSIAEVILHPSYVLKDGNPNDIVLLKLNQSIDVNVYTPICLPTPDTAKLESPGQRLTVAGWGMIGGGVSSNVLLQTTVTMLNSSIPECHPYINNTNKQMCVGVLGGGTGSCSGDSGGPLMAVYNGQYYLVGIVSAGIAGCGNVSSLYIRVSAFTEWICERSAVEPYCAMRYNTTSTTVSGQIGSTTTNNKNAKTRTIIATVVPIAIVFIGVVVVYVLWKIKYAGST